RPDPEITKLLIFFIILSSPLILNAEDRFSQFTPLPQLATPYYNSQEYQESIQNQCKVLIPNDADYALIAAIVANDDRIIQYVTPGLRRDLRNFSGSYSLQKLLVTVSYSYFTQIVLMIYNNAIKINSEFKLYMWLQEALGFKFNENGNLELDDNGNPIRLTTTWMSNFNVKPENVDIELFVDSLMMGMLYNQDPRVKFQCMSILYSIGSIPELYNRSFEIFEFYGFVRDESTGRFYRFNEYNQFRVQHGQIGEYKFCDIDGKLSTGRILQNPELGESFGTHEGD
ncbi:MAG: hypothetical protein QW303_08820, partial [Nitrososphaerota archaeon]